MYWCYNILYKTDASPSALHVFRYSQANRTKIHWRDFIKTVDCRDDFVMKQTVPSYKGNGRTCDDLLEDLCYHWICTLLRFCTSLLEISLDFVHSINPFHKSRRDFVVCAVFYTINS